MSPQGRRDEEPSKTPNIADTATMGSKYEEDEDVGEETTTADKTINERSLPDIIGGGWSDVPMLARLVEEAETGKFYAYCEEVCCFPNYFCLIFLCSYH